MQDDGGAGERPADNTHHLPDDTQRMPEIPIPPPAPWAAEPARRDETVPPSDPAGGAEPTAFGSEMPRGPSPYGPPPAAPPPAYTPPPAAAPPPAYTPPPVYAPPPAYGPQPGTGVPSAGYGGYGAPPMVAPSNNAALGALVCGILAIVLGCSMGPLGAILGAVALFLVNQYTKQQRAQPGLTANPSDATYIQVGRITAFIGLAIGLIYTVLIGCYFLFIFAAIAGGLGSSSYP